MRCRRDRRRLGEAGSATLEFAIVAPVLVLMLIGAFEATQLLRARMKLNHAAGALAKMIAQQTSAVTSGKTGILGNLCTGAEMMLTPLSAVSFTAAIASVTTSASGSSGTDTSMDWESDGSCASSATALGAAKAVSLATSADLVPDAGDSVIIVDVTYTYTAPSSAVLASSYKLTQIVYVRPRANTTIACSTC